MYVYRNVHKLTVTPQTNLYEVLEVFNTAKLVLIVSPVDGGLVGVISESDVRRALLAGAGLSDPVGQYMTIDPIYIENTGSEAIVQVLQDPRFKGRMPELIPVVESLSSVPVGLYRTSDLLYRDTINNGAKDDNNIVVLGGAGYIGSVLTRQLLAAGYRVTVLDKFMYGGESLIGVEDNKNLTIHHVDTRNIDEVVGHIESAGGVVHLAELVGDPLCKDRPRLTLETNYLATCSLARTCTYLQVPRFIYMSSCSVYGASSTGILTEDSPLNPVSLYAQTKINSERALLSMGSSDFAPTIFRLGTAFGLSYRPRFDLVVNVLTAEAIDKGKFTVFGGKQWRPFVHVKDISTAIVNAVKAPIDKVGNQIFNIVGYNHQLSDIGSIVVKTIPGSRMNVDSKSKDQRNYRVTSNKAAQVLAFKPENSIQQGVAEIADVWAGCFNGKYKDSRYYNYTPE